jgi:transcriptional regulator with XRE-family HTH domain
MTILYLNNTISHFKGGALLEKTVFTTDYATLLRLLREIRAEKGMTQIQLAQRLKETQSWVSKCERGEHRLDVLELKAFCAGLDMTLTGFIERLEKTLEDTEKGD